MAGIILEKALQDTNFSIYIYMLHFICIKTKLFLKSTKGRKQKKKNIDNCFIGMLIFKGHLVN